ncbi:MAG: hypothetical protein ACYTAF_08780, partial [Planctomycetota bacterium]
EKKQEETKKEAQPSQEELTGSPLAALRKLRNDLSDESKAKARTIVRNGIGRELTKSVEAWNAGKWTEFRDHLIEASQLSRLYSDKHSKTVMRMLFTLQRELEVRADDLIRLAAAYAKTKDEEAVRGLIAEARKDPFFNGLFGKELSSLEGNVSGWCSSAPSDSDILSEVERWSNRLKVKLGSCPACSGLGGVVCDKCKKEGFVLGECSRCKASGRVNCQLCGGSGKNKHKGYVGIIFLDIPRDFKMKVKIQGKWRTGTMPAQLITYEMSEDSGDGKFTLNTHTKVKPSTKVDKLRGQEERHTFQKPCQEFWDEMERFVFTGKAKIKVPDRSGNLTTYSASSAKRLLADYEHCSKGSVKCERCNGRKKKSCTTCSGSKQSPAVCADCAGGGHAVCETCFGFKKTENLLWVTGLVPPDKVTDLKDALEEHAGALEKWLAERAGQLTWRRNITRSLMATLAKQSPDAEFGEGYVTVKCPKCRGSGGTCQECWGTGKRQYYEGSSKYEEYSTAKQLAERIGRFHPANAGPLPSSTIKETGKVATGIAEMDHERRTQEIRKRIRGEGLDKDLPKDLPPVPSEFRHLPEDVQLHIRRGIAYNQLGEKHFKLADSNVNPSGWVEESYVAIGAYRKAQTEFATAQETLDARGIGVPVDMLRMYRENLQALFWARKHAP